MCVLHCNSLRAVRVTGRMEPPRAPAARRRLGPGRWHVRARLERFTEPRCCSSSATAPATATSCSSSSRSSCRASGSTWATSTAILRSLEREGLVDSTWDDDAAGPGEADLRDHAVGPARPRPVGRGLHEDRAQIDAVHRKRYAEQREVNMHHGHRRFPPSAASATASTSPSAFSSGSRSTSATSSRSSPTSPT